MALIFDFLSILFKNEKMKYEKTIEDLKKEISRLNEEIKVLKLKNKLFEEKGPVPIFLNESKNIYAGSFQFVKSDGKIVNYTLTDFREFYSVHYFSVEFAKKLEGKTKIEKLKAIWDFVIKAGTYERDYVDAWYLPIQTIVKKSFDCEDGTILFLSLSRACGLSSHEVFNAIGPTSFGYHSYPIVYLTKEDGFKDGWYIFETTLDFVPQNPKPLIGSEYWIDDIQNWHYAGTIKKEYKEQFNYSPSSKKQNSDRLERIIENTEEKRKKIIEYWRKENEKH